MLRAGTAKREARVRLRGAIFVLAAAAAACSYALKSPDAPLALPPVEAPAIGAAPADIDASKAETASRYSNYQEDFFETLVSSSESSGLISRRDDAPLRVVASLKYASTSGSPNAFIGVFSLFLPPLAWVTESWTENFTVRYAVRDRNDAIVYRNSYDGSVTGEMKGWYVARINAWESLKGVMAAGAARAAARFVLQDLSAHAAQLSAAPAAAPASERPSRAEPVPGGQAPAADEWWRKPR
jgi:hypothetical protein